MPQLGDAAQVVLDTMQVVLPCMLDLTEEAVQGWNCQGTIRWLNVHRHRAGLHGDAGACRRHGSYAPHSCVACWLTWHG